MGSWWSNNDDAYTTWANSILEEAATALQKGSIKARRQGEVQSSLTYLKRQDVATLAANHLRRIHAIECDIHFQSQLEIVFMELHVRTESNVIYELNFWPCSTCACVSCRELQDED